MEYAPSYNDSLRADILPSYTDSLMHYGVKGMHWGIRRYQNRDGSYTSAGKKHRGISNSTKKNLKVAVKVGAGLAVVGGVAYLKSRSSNPQVMMSDYEKTCSSEAKRRLDDYQDLYENNKHAVDNNWRSASSKMCRQNARYIRNETAEFEKIVSDSDDYIRSRITTKGGDKQSLRQLDSITSQLNSNINTMYSYADKFDKLADRVGH
ncbi:MAG: hypothetical protein J6U54_20430 [Clostridiales bacterium]|nr:hypothetical protein [Clostridiales bacterium]